MTDLTRQSIKEIDKEGMWDLMEDFPRFWRDAVKTTRNPEFNIDLEGIRNVCLVGMGASAIGADLLRGYVYSCCPVPVQVVRHYNLPAWVDENTLFIACSYSGETEETMMALDEARERGARCLALTSGSKLMYHAADVDIDYFTIPSGLPTRAALAYLFVPLFRLFQVLGWLDEGEDALDETVNHLEEQVILYTDLEENEALNLAQDIRDTLPIVYSGGAMLEAVNRRWRGQLEENAKTLAYGNVLPEMNHNEIVGWEQVAHLTGRLSVIMLYDRDFSERITARMNITRELIGDQAVSVTRLDTRGQSRLTRMFSLVQLADWTSLYLALINEVDPTPAARIDLLKSRLAEF